MEHAKGRERNTELAHQRSSLNLNHLSYYHALLQEMSSSHILQCIYPIMTRYWWQKTCLLNWYFLCNYLKTISKTAKTNIAHFQPSYNILVQIGFFPTNQWSLIMFQSNRLSYYHALLQKMLPSHILQHRYPIVTQHWWPKKKTCWIDMCSATIWKPFAASVLS